MPQPLRIALVAVLAVLFIGSIMYSVRAVRHRVDAGRMDERKVTELSLTHSVGRGPDGKLRTPNYKETTAQSEPARPAAKKTPPSKPKPVAVTTPKTTQAPVKPVVTKPVQPTPKSSGTKYVKPASKPKPSSNKNTATKPAPTPKPVVKPASKPAPKPPAPKPAEPAPSTNRACPT